MSTKNKKKSLGKVGTVIVYILLSVAVVVALFPLAWVASTSFKPGNEVFSNPPYWIPKVPTLKNYIMVLTESSIPRAFLNSMIVGGISTFISLILGGSAGYAFARFKFRGSKALSLFMLISQMLPLTVLMIPMYYMGNAVGLVDTKLGLAIAHLAISMPLVTWMAKGYFKGIPKEIEEAAIMDGCTTMQMLTKILIPLLKPALAATGIYAFISSWNEFAIANVPTRSETSRTVPLALSEFASFYRVDWGQTMAAAMIITLPIIIVFMLVQKQFVEGLASGAVKG